MFLAQVFSRDSRAQLAPSGPQSAVSFYRQHVFPKLASSHWLNADAPLYLLVNVKGRAKKQDFHSFVYSWVHKTNRLWKFVMEWDGRLKFLEGSPFQLCGIASLGEEFGDIIIYKYFGHESLPIF